MKAKKVLAMLMASAMIMGTSVTAFAAQTPGYNQNSIKVENLGENATVSYLQIIEPDRTSATGWKFVNQTIQDTYVDAFNHVDTENPTNWNPEQVIWMLLEAKSPNNENIPTEIEAASADQIQAGVDAIEKLTSDEWKLMNVSDTTATVPVNEAGIYVIKAVDDNNPDNTDYVYSGMAAYVSFEYNEDGSADTNYVESATVNAKKTTMEISKSSDEEDDVVAIGDTVTYTINTVVPYIKDNVANDDVVYYITDTLTGAKYNIDGEGYVTLKVKVGVQGEEKEYKAPVVMMENEQQFIVDLSDIAENRANANQPLTITYQATVTGEVVNNTVQPGDGNHNYDKVTDDDTLYTGKITMTKHGEYGTETLAGAEFVLYYEEGGKTYYAEFEEADNFADNAHEYIFTGKWILEEKDGVVPTGATHIVTDSDGEAVVRGLDDDVAYGYKFKEVKAPEGYSINETDASVDGWTGEVDERENTASMNDTKLSSLPLPSTGGIGTTLFTVGGCTIMVAAAGLYFATRKKEQN